MTYIHGVYTVQCTYAVYIHGILTRLQSIGESCLLILYICMQGSGMLHFLLVPINVSEGHWILCVRLYIIAVRVYI